MICSRKEFQDLCGISRANYSTYRDDRGKIVEHLVDGEPFIDTENPVNKAFYENRKIILEKKRQESSGEIPLEESQKKKNPAAKSKTEVTTKHKVNSVTEKTATKRYQLELDQLERSNRQKELKIALDELKIATLSGSNVPMPIVLQMFSELSRSLLIGYKDYTEQLISKFCHKNKISDSIKVDMIAEMVSGLNNTHTKSVNSARAHMKNEMKKSNIKESLFGESENEE